MKIIYSFFCGILSYFYKFVFDDNCLYIDYTHLNFIIWSDYVKLQDFSCFSVFHYYLNGFAEKHQFSLPSFPKGLQLVDVSPFIFPAETLVLGVQSPKEYFGNRLLSLFESISLKNEHKSDSNIFSCMSMMNYLRLHFSYQKYCPFFIIRIME